MEVQGQPRTPPGGNMLSMRSATRLIAGRMRSPYNPPLPARRKAPGSHRRSDSTTRCRPLARHRALHRSGVHPVIGQGVWILVPRCRYQGMVTVTVEQSPVRGGWPPSAVAVAAADLLPKLGCSRHSDLHTVCHGERPISRRYRSTVPQDRYGGHPAPGFPGRKGPGPFAAGWLERAWVV